MKKLVKQSAIFLIICVLTLAAGWSNVIVLAAPPTPSSFFGTVTVDGGNAPDGTVISAWIDDVQYAATASFTYDGNSVYTIDIQGDDPDTANVVEGGVEGDVIVFEVDGQRVEQTGVWHNGSNIELNLSLIAAIPEPKLVSLDPAFGILNSDVDVVVFGSDTHFADGVTNFDFGEGALVTAVDVTSEIQAIANVTIAPDASPGMRTVRATTGDEVVMKSDAFAVRGPGIDVHLPEDAVGPISTQISLTLSTLVDVTGLEILSYEFDLHYDSNVLQAAGVATTETMNEDWNVVYNHNDPGQIRVAAYGTEALSGSGALLHLLFDVTDVVDAETDLTFGSFVFNEGEPGASTNEGYFTARSLNISGFVRYGVISASIPEVTVNLSGPKQATAIADDAGYYQLSVDLVGDYTVMPVKEGDQKDAISVLDAAYVAQCVVGIRPLADCPMDVADASGDAQVRAFDAALIARYVVGLNDPSSEVGTWTFAPPSRIYQPLNASFDNEDYIGCLVGDVTGNWAESAVAAALASSVQVTLPDIVAEANQVLHVPIHIDDLGATPILAFQLTLDYDPAIVKFESVSPDGSMSAGWSVEYNANQPGTLQIAGYGVQPLDGEGPLLYVMFEAIGEPMQNSALLVAAFRFNEGDPSVRASAGSVMMNPTYRFFLPLVQ